MSTFPELVSRFFLQDGDALESGERVPSTSEGNLVTPLIDGRAYFEALRIEMELLTALASTAGEDVDAFFYIIGWLHGFVDSTPPVALVHPAIGSAWHLDVPWAGGALRLEDGSGGPDVPFIDKLQEMADAGVDVRALGWASPLVLNVELVAQSLQEHAFAFNILTIESLQEMRRRIGPGTATLMTLAHPLGSIHLKTVVAGTRTAIRAYVAGIDLHPTRIADYTHSSGEVWHDAGVQIRGPAADSVYAFYRELWNEQIDRVPDRFKYDLETIQSHYTTEHPSVDPPAITPPVSERHSLAPNTPGACHVQALRTLPRITLVPRHVDTFRGELVEKLAVVGTARRPFSFAPDGIFEFRAALRKAIAAAETYIYIEDQAFSAIEVMEWINERLRINPALKVILVWGPDPGDPATPFFHQAINNRLIADVANVNDRVHVFERKTIIVHTKITIIDDVWAAIGSANSTRRSLYTEGELSVSVMEDSAMPFARRLRADLWGELCGLAPGPTRDPLLDLSFAMTVVNEAASLTGPFIGPPSPGGMRFSDNLVRLRLPLEYATTPEFGQLKGSAPTFDDFEYDLKDPDSR